MVAKLKPKGIDGRAPPGVESVVSFDSTRGNSLNERDLDLLNAILGWAANSLEGLLVSDQSQEGNNRSVMLLDVLGRTALH